jgi:hypothetical protein
MAEPVIDRFEMVEIEEKHRGADFAIRAASRAARRPVPKSSGDSLRR